MKKPRQICAVQVQAKIYLWVRDCTACSTEQLNIEKLRC